MLKLAITAFRWRKGPDVDRFVDTELRVVQSTLLEWNERRQWSDMTSHLRWVWPKTYQWQIAKVHIAQRMGVARDLKFKIVNIGDWQKRRKKIENIIKDIKTIKTA